MGYESTCNENWSADQAYQYLGVDKVFYFTGHGNKGLLFFNDSNEDSYMEACGNQRNLKGLKNINKLSYNKLSNVQLMFFNSCYSALSMSDDYADYKYYNLLDVAKIKGAKCVIGFREKVDSYKSFQWAQYFFYYLSLGQTVAFSINGADNDLQYLYGSSHGGTRSHDYRGDTSIKIKLN